jgi:hypothetical protein
VSKQANRTAAQAAAIIVAAAAILFLMERPPICTCGRIALWGAVGPDQSQMLADWYSFSHVIHGVLFFALLRLAVPRWPVGRRFVIALLIETAWEVVENTPMVINRYREATMALGYSGDSILNSLSDIGMMAIGFLIARKLPPWITVALVIAFELIPLFAIRDNLTLNVWMLLFPDPAIAAWQAGG